MQSGVRLSHGSALRGLRFTALSNLRERNNYSGIIVLGLSEVY
jgi:hypothetical protein